jgi:hypothetical protein
VESPDCVPSEDWEAVADAGATAASDWVWENVVAEVNRVVAAATDVSEFEVRIWEVVVADAEVVEVLLTLLKSKPAVGEVLVLSSAVEVICAGGPRMMPVVAAPVRVVYPAILPVNVGVTVTSTTDIT